MKKFIAFVFFAFFTTVVSYAQENVFIINGKQVENFDGSQLTGKKILSFLRQKTGGGELFVIHTDEILPDSLRNRKVNVKRKVSVIHQEATDTIAAANNSDGMGGKRHKVEVETTSFKTMPLIIVDGKEYGGSLSDINPDNIEHVYVYKAGSDVANDYGEKGKNGVMKIFTKATTGNIVYIINGKPTTYREISDIPASKISNINVLKRGSKAALKYGENGKTHDIVIIETK